MSNNAYSPIQYVCCNTHSIAFTAKAYLLLVEPSSYAEASLYPERQQATANEISALEANNTRVLVPLPLGKKAINCKWVFKVTHYSDKSIGRYKARLVVKGFT